MTDQNGPDLKAVVAGNTAFAFDLYQKLRRTPGNLFLSPHSISTALAMTYAGARGNTERQMAQTLHFALGGERLHAAFRVLEAELRDLQESGAVQLRLANALWPQRGYGLLEDYLALTEAYYGVSITPVDYAGATEEARRTINAWVEGRTEDKIRELLKWGILQALTRLVLTNAIYFKGDWASQFPKDRTKKEWFWVTPSESVRVPMMAQQGEFGYAMTGGLQILELPYVGDALSLIVLLPAGRDGLAALEGRLTAEHVESWTGRLWPREVRVILPRFKLSSSFELARTLADMGMPDAFNELADFSGMDGRKHWLYIGEVVHGAVVDVNEEGTEAAAATAVVMHARGGIPRPPPTFRADRPFLFLIRDRRTGAILFLGRLVDPTAGD